IHKIKAQYQAKDKSFLKTIDAFQKWVQNTPGTDHLFAAIAADPINFSEFSIHSVVPQKWRLPRALRKKRKPAVDVNWYEAMGYAYALSCELRSRHEWMRREGWLVRLPTEAEW
ncbi:MAG TPA: hypothetical protein DF383_12585, partial [Deltaproteobacteria bacterium]|nr:hypothetical protein [Deltaproteobacteria bacterium]